jgi:hypothetical protein
VKYIESKGEITTLLCMGEPDFAPPSCMIDAASKAMVADKMAYTTYGLGGRRGGIDVGGAQACLFLCNDENG